MSCPGSASTHPTRRDTTHLRRWAAEAKLTPRSNWSYSALECDVRANLVYRDFSRVGAGKMPNTETVGRWTGARTGCHKGIHDWIVQIAFARRWWKVARFVSSGAGDRPDYAKPGQVEGGLRQPAAGNRLRTSFLNPNTAAGRRRAT